MTELNGNPVKSRSLDFKTADLKLGNGWTARVVLADSADNRLSPDDWARCLTCPESLTANPQKIIKDDGRNPVIVKKIQIGNKQLTAHIKARHLKPSFRNFCRTLLASKAIRNFRTSRKLCENNIPTARPLAALQQKKLGLTIRSIYITEYEQNSTNLYDYLRTCTPQNRPLKHKLKKRLLHQIAHIFASLHRVSLWHRDAKASNFLITGINSHNECKLILVDMDGIKSYRFRRRYSRFHPFAKLAASVFWHPFIYRTDYLRTFTIYSNLTRLETEQRRPVFKELIKHAIAIRVLSLVKNASAKRSPCRILIIKPSALGDIALATPVLSSLRASFPNASISWLVRSEFAPLLENNKHLDNIILFDRKLFGKWYYHPRAFTALVRFIAQLREPKFDLVIDLQGLFRTALFAWFTGSKKRFGMKASRECSHLFYTHRISPPSDSQHVIDYYNAVVAATGAKKITADFNLTCPADAERDITPLLTAQNIKPHKYAVFVPGSAHLSKCWPAQNFARLAEQITKEFHLPIVAVGTAWEKPIVNQIKSIANAPVINFAGITDIPKLIALLKNAKIVVTNDTGPGHIAAALNVPLVMIFGPTNPARVGPYRKPQTIAALDPKDRGSQIESNNPKYKIDAIPVGLVLQKVRNQIAPSSL